MIWQREKEFHDLYRDLFVQKVTRTIFFFYDMDRDSQRLALSVVKAEFSTSEYADVSVFEKDWEAAFNVQFNWYDDADASVRNQIEQRLRDIAVQYDAVLDVMDRKGI